MAKGNPKHDGREERIPELALEAFREAYERARASGCPVVVAEGSRLVSIQPDGSRKFLKKIPSKVKLSVSSKAALKP